MESSENTLQTLCIKIICDNSDFYSSEKLGELNHPCLKQIAHDLSLQALLRYEELLHSRGIQTNHLISTLLHSCLNSMDSYPVRSTTLPHLLRVTKDESWTDALSRLLFRRVFVPILEEHGAMIKSGQTRNDYLTDIFSKNEYKRLKDLFLPRHNLKKKSKRRVQISHQSVIEFCTMVASKIVFIVLDLNFCDFVTDPLNQDIFSALCKSINSIYVIIQNCDIVMNVIDKLREEAKLLDRVCLYCMKASSMNNFDTIVSKISGVKGLYETKNVTKESQDFCGMKGSKPKDQFWNTAGEDVDLMDDALLADVTRMPRHHDSMDGVSSLVFKTTNLVPISSYEPVLDHHFKHWLALKQLDFGGPVLDKGLAEGISILIQRPTFRSLALSSLEIKREILEDLLLLIARCRKRDPLNELFLIGLQQTEGILQEIKWSEAPGPRIVDMNDMGSKKLSEQGIFRGTKLFEISGSVLDFRTHCLIRQYILADAAIEHLCINASLERQVLESTFLELAEFERPMTQLIVENICLTSLYDCSALIKYLNSVSHTLTSLSLKSSFCMREDEKFRKCSEAILRCSVLKSLDMSDNMLSGNICSFMEMMVFGMDHLKEISIRNNDMSKIDIIALMFTLSDKAGSNPPLLDILDIRGNEFKSGDIKQAKFKITIARATKRFIYDEGPSV